MFINFIHGFAVFPILLLNRANLKFLKYETDFPAENFKQKPFIGKKRNQHHILY
jgi:hypothetical protein